MRNSSDVALVPVLKYNSSLEADHTGDVRKLLETLL